MESYRRRLYAQYVSAHTSKLYGASSAEAIRKQFPLWLSIYGQFLPTSKTARTLDLGCGNGGFVWFLQQLGYAQSFGVDASVQQIGEARKLEVNNVVEGDLVEYLSSAESSFDFVACRDVLEHFSKNEVLQVLDKVHAVLRPGGSFLVQVPNGDSPFHGRIRYGDFTHELCFTASSASQILSVAGFEVITFHPLRPVVHGFKSAVRYVLWRIIELIYELVLGAETGVAHGIFTQNLLIHARKSAYTTTDYK